MTGDIAFCTTTSVLATKGEHITTVATPIRTDVGNGFETMGDTMVYLLCIVVLKRGKGLMSEEVQRFVFKDTYPCIRLRYTLSYYLFIAFLVTSIPAIFTLIAYSV